MNKLVEFLQEDNGGLSATRLAFLLWAVGVLVVWAIESLASQPMTMAHIDPSVTTIVGILMTGKVVQKFGEKAAPGGNGSSVPGAGNPLVPGTGKPPGNPAQPIT